MIVSLHRNLDLLRLRLLLLRQVHLQDTVLHPCGDLLPIDRGGQHEGAMEGTVQPFDPVVAFLLYLLLDLSLPSQREDSILDLDADGFLVHAGKLRPDADRVLGFIDVHGRHPNAGSQCFLAAMTALREVSEELIHPVLKGCDVPERIRPTNQCHDVSSFPPTLTRSRNLCLCCPEIGGMIPAISSRGLRTPHRPPPLPVPSPPGRLPKGVGGRRTKPPCTCARRGGANAA